MACTKPVHRHLAAVSICALAALPAGTALGASEPLPPTKPTPSTPHSVLKSRLLWATIDVCSPADQPDTIGIRGSMPGDDQTHGTMYMSFRVQYLDPTTTHWVDLGGGASTGFVEAGTAAAPRQAGRSFTLTPVPGKPAFTLRGVVSFQWRLGASIVQSGSRTTTPGRHSLAGADPASFSAASCQIG